LAQVDVLYEASQENMVYEATMLATAERDPKKLKDFLPARARHRAEDRPMSREQAAKLMRLAKGR